MDKPGTVLKDGLNQPVPHPNLSPRCLVTKRDVETNETSKRIQDGFQVLFHGIGGPERE